MILNLRFTYIIIDYEKIKYKFDELKTKMFAIIFPLIDMRLDFKKFK